MDKNESIGELLTRGVDEVIDMKHLEEALNSGKKLRVKLGIDPTGANLHIGHAVALWKLRAFQDLGHKAVFIIGDATGIVGDTSDKDSERPMLTKEQVKVNMKTYMEQAHKILDPKKTEIHYNSEWLSKLDFLELAKMANLFGLHEFSSRDVIARRLKAGKRVSYLELMYPLMQGYDSVAIKADVELGAIDQRFNLLTGRTLQRHYGQESQDIVTLKYLTGTDGRKMSKSWGNSINIMDDAQEMFGKIMSIPDDLIVPYFELATRVSMDEVRKFEKELNSGANPRHIKKRLGEEIVTLYHGSGAAADASEEFDKVFSRKEKPSDMPEVRVVDSQNIIDLLVETKLAPSKSEARRLVEQGGVKLNDQVITEWDTLIDIEDGHVLQAGKRKFVRLRK